MKEQDTSEKKLYTSEEVDEILQSRRRAKEEYGSTCRYGGEIRERNRIISKLIELDVSINIIDELFNEPEIRKKGYTKELFQKKKIEHWQKQMEKKQ